jgi:hypothetical protein
LCEGLVDSKTGEYPDFKEVKIGGAKVKLGVIKAS